MAIFQANVAQVSLVSRANSSTTVENSIPKLHPFHSPRLLLTVITQLGYITFKGDLKEQGLQFPGLVVCAPYHTPTKPNATSPAQNTKYRGRRVQSCGVGWTYPNGEQCSGRWQTHSQYFSLLGRIGQPANRALECIKDGEGCLCDCGAPGGRRGACPSLQLDSTAVQGY